MASEKKRLAIIISERQAEGLRMAVGMSVLGDTVDVYLMDCILEKGAHIDMSLEALGQMGGSVFSNVQENQLQTLNTEDVARRLTDYDVILPY